MSADLLELNPKHKSILTKLYYECKNKGMNQEDAFKEMYRLFFEDEKNWLSEEEAM